MKSKRFDKKLVLNKKTIAHLGNGEMSAVQGGFPQLTEQQTGCGNPKCATLGTFCCAT